MVAHVVGIIGSQKHMITPNEGNQVAEGLLAVGDDIEVEIP
jgi:hypothetical protein